MPKHHVAAPIKFVVNGCIHETYDKRVVDAYAAAREQERYGDALRLILDIITEPSSAAVSHPPEPRLTAEEIADLIRANVTIINQPIILSEVGLERAAQAILAAQDAKVKP